MNREIKEEFIRFLEDREEFFKPVHDNWYRTRCPYCGDTQSNLREGHFYINIDLENDYRMGFNCFRCGEHGTINEETIDLMGGYSELKQKIGILNKHSKVLDKRQLMSEDRLLYFDYKLPKPTKGKKIDYVENRLGLSFSEAELGDIKIITSLSDFVQLNKIKEFPFENWQLQRLEDHYVGFLSNGNSHILFRDITDKEHTSWIKYPITKDCMRNMPFYSIASIINPYTSDEITINLSEGVMDAIGVGFHLNQLKENSMNLAVLGKKYELMIYRLIQLGLVGSNITVNIYSDNDKIYGNKKNNFHTTMEYYKKSLKRFCPLFKRINVYYNMKAKDFGYPKEKISIQKNIV